MASPARIRSRPWGCSADITITVSPEPSPRPFSCAPPLAGVATRQGSSPGSSTPPSSSTRISTSWLRRSCGPIGSASSIRPGGSAPSGYPSIWRVPKGRSAYRSGAWIPTAPCRPSATSRLRCGDGRRPGSCAPTRGHWTSCVLERPSSGRSTEGPSLRACSMRSRPSMPGGPQDDRARAGLAARFGQAARPRRSGRNRSRGRITPSSDRSGQEGAGLEPRASPPKGRTWPRRRESRPPRPARRAGRAGARRRPK